MHIAPQCFPPLLERETISDFLFASLNEELGAWGGGGGGGGSNENYGTVTSTESVTIHFKTAQFLTEPLVKEKLLSW